jgi:hypothetical protein
MIRKSLLLSCMFPVAALAANDLPAPSNPIALAMVKRFEAVRSKLDPALLFQPPAEPVKSACVVPESLPYRLTGLFDLHPDLKPEADEMRKNLRKTFRESGQDPDSYSPPVTSNVSIANVEIPCAGGALTGNYVFIISYDSTTTTKTPVAIGTKINTMTSQSVMHYKQRVEAPVVNGLPVGEDRTLYMAYTSESEMHSDDPNMEKNLRKSNKQTAELLDAAQFSVTFTYDGARATFGTAPEVKVVRGFLGLPKVAADQTMTTMLTYPIDEHHQVTDYYNGASLTSHSPMKDGKNHGESVLYTENIYKKLKLRVDQQPGMENAREITVDGKELIEQRTCYQNGQQVKMSPCPAE